MKKYFLFLFLILFIGNNSSAQDIHWANEIVSFSSEANDAYRYYSAEQVLGVPNAIGEKDLSPWAWQPKRPNAGKEYVRVKFKAGTKGVRQIYISESASPGAITKITLHDTNGKRHVAYVNKNPRPLGVFERYRMFYLTFPPTSYYVEGCTVEINTKAVPGANLDAIGISTDQGAINIRKQINNLIYSTPVGKPENLGRQVNSNYMERLPIVSPDGNTLYFTRKYHPENMGSDNQDDIWVSKRLPNNQWSYAENIGAPLNNNYHNYVVAINPAGTNIYLANKYRSNSGGLSISSPKKGTWAKPIGLKIKNFYNDNIFAEYHISVDEQVMILAIERSDGFGERDLYVSFNQGEGSWTTPMNMGSTLNTVNIESSVFLAADNKTLYFCSNGHYGYGGLDVFMTKRKDSSWTNWTTPKNLGPKINSNGNDYNFTIPASAEYAYFSSEENSYGQSDLFRIKLPEEARPEPVMLMSGKIVDVTTNKPVQAKVKYNPLDKNKSQSDNKETSAQDDGSYQVVVPYGKDMEVYADIEGYFAVSQSMELSGDDLEGLDSDDPNDPLLNPKNSSNKLSREEVALEKELARLNQELVDLKRKREERKSRPSRTKESYLNKPSVKSNSKPKPRPRPAQDSELDYLKKKYYDQLNAKNTKPKAEKAKKNGEQVSEMYDKLYGKKEEKANKPTKPKPRKESEEVSDIYGKLYGEEKEDKPKKANDPFAPEEEEEEEEEDAPSFEEIEDAIREELRQELREQIEAELRKELMKEIETELKAKAKDDDILEDAVAEVEREKLVELNLIPLGKNTLEVDREIKLELREIILEDVAEELKEELEEELKEELKEEVVMKVKEKEKDAAEKRMDDWKKRRERDNSPTASKPSSSEKPEYVELNQNIEVVPIKVGQVIPMNNIFFDANKSTIKGQSSAELERVLAFLKKNNKLIVEVGGHTNGWCSTAFASELSRGRAKAVMDYFIANGVPKDRIQYKGYGKLEPIASNESLAGRKKNQRVELKILEIVD